MNRDDRHFSKITAIFGNNRYKTAVNRYNVPTTPKTGKNPRKTSVKQYLSPYIPKNHLRGSRRGGEGIGGIYPSLQNTPKIALSLHWGADLYSAPIEAVESAAVHHRCHFSKILTIAAVTVRIFSDCNRHAE